METHLKGKQLTEEKMQSRRLIEEIDNDIIWKFDV